MLSSMRPVRLSILLLIAQALCCSTLTKAKQDQNQEQEQQEQQQQQRFDLLQQSSEVVLNYSILSAIEAAAAAAAAVEPGLNRVNTVESNGKDKEVEVKSRKSQYRSNNNNNKLYWQQPTKVSGTQTKRGPFNDQVEVEANNRLESRPHANSKTTANNEHGDHSNHLDPIKWGPNLTSNDLNKTIESNQRRWRRQVASATAAASAGLSTPPSSSSSSSGFDLESCNSSNWSRPAIFGIRCDNGGDVSDGILVIKANEPTEVMLIGRNLDTNISIALTPEDHFAQADCTHADRVKSINFKNISSNIALVVIDISASIEPTKRPYYLCLRDVTGRWWHQGSAPWLKLYVKEDWLPVYAKIILVAFLLMLSGLFSGLNLGLMALDKNELQVIISCGSDTEKRYARAIEPVRRRGNYLLCSILFSNVLVNSTIAVLLEELTSGIVAVMTSTIFIVMFGEILPQAFCSRHGLAVGAKTVSITYFCMIVTFPLSYPVSSCLDWALGEEIGHAYDRERLMEFIRVTRDYNNLETDEVNIISGALKLKRIPLSEIMTRIEDVYMLDLNSSLDFDTIQAIIERGYSRVPVHEPGNKKNIVALLFAKDLALLDPDNRTPVQTLISFYNHPIMYLFEDTTLDLALNEFKTGKSHMAFVRRVIDDGDRDPVYEITGIVTLEDVIEEIMQMEINDETDMLSDNKRKRRRKEAQVRRDFAQFTTNQFGAGESSFNIVTPQLCLAAYQYLATTVEAFSTKFISDTVLKRLLSQRIYYKVRLDSTNNGCGGDDDNNNNNNNNSGGGGGVGGGDSSANNNNSNSANSNNNNNSNCNSFSGASPYKSRGRNERRLYTAGEPADYFIMILEGRVNVACGKENLAFAGGPFSYFGKAALVANPIGESKLLDSPMITSVSSGGGGGGSADLTQPLLPGPLAVVGGGGGCATDSTTRHHQQQQQAHSGRTRDRESLIELRKISGGGGGGGGQLSYKRTSGDTTSASDNREQQQQQQQQEAGSLNAILHAGGSSVINFATGLPARIKSSASRTSINSMDAKSGGAILSQQSTATAAAAAAASLSSSYIVPDYTVEIATDTSYLKITRQEYLAALKASLVERGSTLTIRGGDNDNNDDTNDNIDYNANGTNRNDDDNGDDDDYTCQSTPARQTGAVAAAARLINNSSSGSKSSKVT